MLVGANFALCATAIALMTITPTKSETPFPGSHSRHAEPVSGGQTATIDASDEHLRTELLPHHSLPNDLPISAESDMQRRQLQSTPVDTCLENLSSVATNGRLTIADYLEFLALQSGGNLDAGSLSELPAELIAVLYYAACYNQDCTQGPPSVDLTDSAVLLDLCEISDSFTNPDPIGITDPPTPSPASIVRVNRFNYIISTDSGLTADEILAGADGNKIVQDLITATQNVILKELNCTDNLGTVDLGRKLGIFRTHTYLGGIHHSDGLAHLGQMQRLDQKAGASHEASLQELYGLERLLQDGCGFQVTATIDNLADTGKKTILQNVNPFNV